VSYSLTESETLVFNDRQGVRVAYCWTGTLIKENYVEACRRISDSADLDDNTKRLLWTPSPELLSKGLNVEVVAAPDKNSPLAMESA
jgi:hypothetical protein